MLVRIKGVREPDLGLDVGLIDLKSIDVCALVAARVRCVDDLDLLRG